MKLNSLAVSFAFVLFCGFSTFAQDLKVFGLELAKPLAIPECPFGINTGQEGRGLFAKKYHHYGYYIQPDVKETCFKRVNNRFFDMPTPRSTPLPTLVAPKEASVKIVFSSAGRPGILAKDLHPEMSGVVDENGALVLVQFRTDWDRSKDVFAVLTQKYGKQTSGKSYDAISSYGTIREFSIYEWDLKQLKVSYRTLINGTSLASTWGDVEISYQQKKVIKDNNPL
jgi:hypothetical protein